MSATTAIATEQNMIIPRNNGYICRQPIDLAVFFMIAIRYDFELSRQTTLKKPVVVQFDLKHAEKKHDH